VNVPGLIIAFIAGFVIGPIATYYFVRWAFG